jgi:DNA polymerase III delta subunit
MTHNSTKKNIFLFYGEDDFSLRRKIDIWKTEFSKKYSAQAITIVDGSEMGENEVIQSLQGHLAPSLFASKKLLILKNVLPKKADQEKLSEFLLGLPESAPKDYFIVFWQGSKPDGRLKFNKQFSALVTVQEFALPHGVQLNSWLKAMAKTMGAEISDQAVEKLAVFLGRDLGEEKKAGGRVIERKEAFDLWQAYSELSKLSSNTSNITPDLVAGLVKPKVPDSVFALTDNIASGNRTGAFQALENSLSSSAGDDKGAFIKIVGLLSEQVRSLLNVSLLKQEGLSDADIAEKLGYSPGRVFILTKHSRNFSADKLKKLIMELSRIDYALKSSDANPHLLVDLFITQTTLNGVENR